MSGAGKRSRKKRVEVDAKVDVTVNNMSNSSKAVTAPVEASSFAVSPLVEASTTSGT